MSLSRACLPCKAAKLPCDLARPKCGRCDKHNVLCTGLPLDSVFVFRNENEVAKRNSRRARGARGQSSVEATGWSQAEVSSSAPERASSVLDEGLHENSPWHNQQVPVQVSEPLKRDVETRAIERFFVNWTLYPNNRGLSPGYMEDLPRFYHSTHSDSVLGSSVRAMAFADLKGTGGLSFNRRARQQYGAALHRMRAVASDQEQIASDTTLYATILMDNFELIHLGRNDPLGPHRDAIKHILRIRGDGQLYSPTRFSLWRLVHYRLQFWQMLALEEPTVEQQLWLSKLNLERPELRICAEVLKMQVLNATAKQLAQTSGQASAADANHINNVLQLIIDIQNHLVVTESWSSEMSAVWKVHVHDCSPFAEVQVNGDGTSSRIPEFPYPTFLSYDDLWLAYIWNFYLASLIILRESLVDMISIAVSIQNYANPSLDRTEILRQQHGWIERHSASILGSFPMLLGAMTNHGSSEMSQLSQQGKMAGQLFALYSMWAIQKGKYTPLQHKQTASEVIDWINLRHGLDKQSI